MAKNGFTIVVIPEKTAKVRRLTLPKYVAFGSIAMVLGLVLVGFAGLYRSVLLESRLDDYNELKNRFLLQQIEIKRVSNEIDNFRGRINRLRELDYKLRLITDLEVERPSPSMYGIGGSIDSHGGELTGKEDLSQMDLLTLLDKDLARLKEMASYQEESFNNLKTFLVDQKDILQRSPYRWPVRGFVSSNYGGRVDPFTGLQKYHEGLDIVAPKGTIVKAPADGIVTYNALDPTLGNMLVIDHGYGVITRYGHSKRNLVREGQRVSRGDPIATVGSTGKSTGPHLHYEIRINDLAINPLNYILE